MDKNENKVMIVISIIFIIITGIFHRGIIKTRESITDITFKFTDLRITKLDTTGINTTLIYNLQNPSKIPLSVSIQGFIYYDNNLLAPILIVERNIPANSSNTIEAHIYINKTQLHVIEDPQNKRMYQTRGSITIVGRYLSIIKVEITDDVNAYNVHN